MIEEEKGMEIKYSKRIWKRRKNRRGDRKGEGNI